MELKGQVTISIDDFEKLKAAADAKEYVEISWKRSGTG